MERSNIARGRAKILTTQRYNKCRQQVEIDTQRKDGCTNTEHRCKHKGDRHALKSNKKNKESWADGCR